MKQTTVSYTIVIIVLIFNLRLVYSLRLLMNAREHQAEIELGLTANGSATCHINIFDRHMECNVINGQPFDVCAVPGTNIVVQCGNSF